jgi:purine-binding chemotaxis protein CheW
VTAVDAITFSVAGHHWAVPASTVREVFVPTVVTAVPHAPRTVAGIVNVRGHVVCLVDAGAALGLRPRAQSGAGAVFLLADRGGLVGLVVDEVVDVAMLDLDADAVDHGGRILRRFDLDLVCATGSAGDQR